MLYVVRMRERWVIKIYKDQDGKTFDKSFEFVFLHIIVKNNSIPIMFSLEDYKKSTFYIEILLTFPSV